jgi:hypothetical protein
MSGIVAKPGGTHVGHEQGTRNKEPETRNQKGTRKQKEPDTQHHKMLAKATPASSDPPGRVALSGLPRLVSGRDRRDQFPAARKPTIDSPTSPRPSQIPRPFPTPETGSPSRECHLSSPARFLRPLPCPSPSSPDLFGADGKPHGFSSDQKATADPSPALFVSNSPLSPPPGDRCM